MVAYLISCARATRGLRRVGGGVTRCPSCSQNAHGKMVLVRCPQWEIKQDTLPEKKTSKLGGSIYNFVTPKCLSR
jgi:hypothetical protein